jgi:hypothetical protein
VIKPLSIVLVLPHPHKQPVLPAGFEPATCGLGIRCSILLSYESGILLNPGGYLSSPAPPAAGHMTWNLDLPFPTMWDDGMKRLNGCKT